MAENCNVLDNMNDRVSNDLNATVSEVFEDANSSFGIENKAIKISEPTVGNLNTGECLTDPNSNVSLGEFDFSISEAFSRMKLQSENDSSCNLSGETSFRVAEDSPKPENCSPKILQDGMPCSNVDFSQRNSNSPLTSREISLCLQPNPHVEEISLPLEGNVTGQDVSNNNLLDDTVALPESKELQNSSDVCLVASPLFSTSKPPEPDSTLVPSADFGSNTAEESPVKVVPAENPDSSLANLPVTSAEAMDHLDSVTIPVDNVLENPNLVSSSSQLVESTEANILEKSNLVSSSSLPVESTEAGKANVDSSKVSNFSPVCELQLRIAEEKVADGVVSTENQNVSFTENCPVKPTELNDGTDLSCRDAKNGSFKISNSDSLNLDPKASAENVDDASSVENKDINDLPYKSPEAINFNRAGAITKGDDADVFKVPALPQKYTETKPISCLDVSEQELLDQSISFHTSPEVLREVSISDLSLSTADVNTNDLSKNADNRETSLAGAPTARQNNCISPGPMASANLKDSSHLDLNNGQSKVPVSEQSSGTAIMDTTEVFSECVEDWETSDAPTVTNNNCISPGSVISAHLGDPSDLVNLKDDLFKVPEQPQDEEMFVNAVQFFKDPSSFQFLEKIPTCPSESDILRSSLYVAFDPLHSKTISRSRAQDLPRLQESEVKPRKNGSVLVAKHLIDASVRESMGNALISFDSPKAQSGRVEDMPVMSDVPKLYTEEEVQQALKMHELALQEKYLRQHRELEQEMAKLKEDNKAVVEKLTFLCKTQKFTIEELVEVASSIRSSKVEVQEKLSLAEEEKQKLEQDLKASNDDLQTTETMFADFHKRYEQCKSMLKTYKENEVHLKEGVEQWKAKMAEQEQKYNALQERTEEILEKANAEVASAKKSCDGQVTVLKAQLKKAELKIFGLESDIKQVKIENSKLGGICDDLMARVSEG